MTWSHTWKTVPLECEDQLISCAIMCSTYLIQDFDKIRLEGRIMALESFVMDPRIVGLLEKYN